MDRSKETAAADALWASVLEVLPLIGLVSGGGRPPGLGLTAKIIPRNRPVLSAPDGMFQVLVEGRINEYGPSMGGKISLLRRQGTGLIIRGRDDMLRADLECRVVLVDDIKTLNQAASVDVWAHLLVDYYRDREAYLRRKVLDYSDSGMARIKRHPEIDKSYHGRVTRIAEDIGVSRENASRLLRRLGKPTK